MSQFFDTVWNDFLSVKKDFNRYIIIGVLCVFITHFYVIESYFFYKNQQKKAVKELKEKKVQLEKLLKQLEYLETTYKKVHKPLQNIQEKIRAFPQHLREVCYLKYLKSEEVCQQIFLLSQEIKLSNNLTIE